MPGQSNEFTAAALPANQPPVAVSSFAEFLESRRGGRACASPVPVENTDLEARMYRWIRAVALSDSQELIVDSLESISARPITAADFDMAILKAMDKYPTPEHATCVN